ncbi:MAG TPA: S-ribosylhomocysteine lyase [Steroidobacteraceae bacterium]|nr:S-ribosylhomocysteine lyase [Steroidobacteraceae bacterium]
MIDVEALGWDAKTVGELDHRLLKVPSLKLRSATPASNGVAVYCVDLRVRRPNAGKYLSATELHSVEHFLLAGFQRTMPAHFLSVGIMGCQTGFYLVFLNEGRSRRICQALEEILTDVQGATAVPYARIDQCGNYRNHSLERARKVAREMLEAKSTWLEVV